MIKGKSPEEIRKLFNIVNDFTPEEEASRATLVDRRLLTDFTFFRLKSRRKTWVLHAFYTLL